MKLFSESRLLNDWWKYKKSKEDEEVLVWRKSKDNYESNEDLHVSSLRGHANFHTFSEEERKKIPFGKVSTIDNAEILRTGNASSNTDSFDSEVFETDFLDKRMLTMHICSPPLHRAKSDNIIKRGENARKYGSVGDILHNHLTKTQIVLPGEFLFCNTLDQSNSFASLFPSLSKGDIKRSLSCGVLGKSANETEDSEKDDFSIKKSSNPEIRMAKNKCTSHDHHQKLFVNNEEKSPEEVNNKLLSKNDSFSLPVINIRRSSKEKKETVYDDIESESTTKRKNTLKVPSHLKVNSNRRSESCKTTRQRNDKLFNINKYLKGRHKQRSKSFATVREFSNFNASDSIDNISNQFINDEYHDHCFSSRSRDGTRKYKRADTSHQDNIAIETTMNFDVNHTDKHGNSCLHHASSKGDISTIKFLLEQGGNVWLKNDQHMLPLDVAQNFQTAKLLSCATVFYSDQTEQRNESNIAKTSKLNIAL